MCRLHLEARLLQHYIHSPWAHLPRPERRFVLPQVQHPYQAKSVELLGVVGFDRLEPGQRSTPLLRGSPRAGTRPHLKSASPL